MPLTLEMKRSTLPQSCLTVALKFGTAEQTVLRQQKKPITGLKKKSSSETEREKGKKSLKTKLKRNYSKLAQKLAFPNLSDFLY